MNKMNIIKDLLVNFKNGYSNKNKYAYCRINSLCIKILWELYKEELIHDFYIDIINNKVIIRLKYSKNKPLISNFNLISKPSLINFSTSNDLSVFYKTYDYFFVSTSSGILSSKLLKKKTQLGGQVLFGINLQT